jgi:hypothetical protein
VGVVEVGGSSQPHESPFGEAGTRLASRAASLGQTAALMAYLRSYLRDRRPPSVPVEAAVGVEEPADWRRLQHDLPYVYRYLWGGRSPDGSWRAGLSLDQAYQAWIRAASQAGQDPRGASAVMELCRQRMAACAGGPELMRVYFEHLYDGLGRVEAMRRAWSQTAAARRFAGRRARQHGGRRGELGSPAPGGRNLPVPATGLPGPPGGEQRLGPGVAAAEAARLLGAPEVTLPELRRFQDRCGGAAARDGAGLARQWLADALRGGRIDQVQHDAWRGMLDEAGRGREPARGRADGGLVVEAARAARAAPAAGGTAERPGRSPGPGQAGRRRSAACRPRASGPGPGAGRGGGQLGSVGGGG